MTQTLSEVDREFWNRALRTGGITHLPRWNVQEGPGTAEVESPLPDRLVRDLQALGEAQGTPLSTLLLTAHVRVLAALSGETDVSTGYTTGAGRAPLPLRVDTDVDSWRTLLSNARAAETALLRHQSFPVAELSRQLGLTAPTYEAALDPASTPGDLDEGVILMVGVAHRDDRMALRIRHRIDAMDGSAAARILGYHVRALELLVIDPGADHRRQSLLGSEELHLQLEGLAGPRRELPDLRMHELFERQVQAHPDRIAAVHGDQQWTYRELNDRANRLGRILLSRGLQSEDVVAVVTERNLDWMSSVLAVLKAGGVYLPIEPHFPADRIAATLGRARCEFVLTEVASTTTLNQALEALPAVQIVLVDQPHEEDEAGGDLGVAVSPSQLAYIYFTSGSTGEPKGAMCEHAGLVNHLFAKIDDLEIGEGQVVAQTAPQCFDISLWQLVAAVIVGGRTLVVEQEVILDAQRFVDKIVHGKVNVLQVVPSYLEVVLTYLEQHPRQLPDLRYVSVTGEALKKELTQRWFDSLPVIKLVNAYGLTETSDDTNHEVMDRVPDRDRVPLGRPVNNVNVYVVDEQLQPVPLGAPGEIVFSGVCVGRGYVNDPERTAAAFLADPHRPGVRLYRSGDYGRWLPEGKLEFLGRRDSQVKISGFRIEIGEIENRLLSVPGVRDGAVVVAERADRSKHLVGFYSGPRPLEVSLLRERLGVSLPDYMVPSIFHWRQQLPLTANSKIDKSSLAALAGELDGRDRKYEAPKTATEERLAAAWAQVLGITPHEISRHDDFFDRGGTSLSAVKLAINLERAVSLKDVTRNPVLADLAATVDGRCERSTGLLHSLMASDRRQADALVCFPYAGGNAVNFQPMAAALRDAQLAVYAVELPGHDLAAEREPFAHIGEVAERVVAEIVTLGLTRILLWGHSSGAAFALATATRLEERGVEVARVFLAAQLVGNAGDRRAAAAELAARSDRDLAAHLSADRGYAELGQLDAHRAEQVGAAYRHDALAAHRYLTELLDNPPAVKLAAPVTVVVAEDDPSTAGAGHRYQDWQALADHVELWKLEGGGHYFLRTRPADAARAVLRHSSSPDHPPKGPT